MARALLSDGRTRRRQLKHVPLVLPGAIDKLIQQVHTARTTASLSIFTAGELERCSAEWDTIGSDRATPIQQFNWIRAAAAFHDAQLRVIVVRTGEQTAAAAPLVLRASGGLSRLELIGASELHEAMDFVYADQGALDALAAEVARTGLPLWLERVPADSPTVAALRGAMQGRGVVITRPEHGCPWIPLDEGWTEPLAKFNSGRRSDFRRMQRRAAQLGTVTYEVHAPSPDALHPLLAEAFRVEAASWKGRTGTALANDEAARRFFVRYANDACAKGILRLCFMRIDGRPVGMQIALDDSRRFWLLKIGYDEAYARCSPGSLLMLHTLSYAARRGLASCEFLGTEEAWTDVWTDRIRPCVSVRIYPANARGMAALSVDALQSMWAKTKEHFRAP